MKNETKDLFETPELMPAELAAIFEGSEDGIDYSDLKVMLDKAKSIGYTFDYSLDAVPYGLRKMTDAYGRETTPYTLSSETTTIVSTVDDFDLVKTHICNNYLLDLIDLQPMYLAYKGVVYEKLDSGLFSMTTELYVKEDDVIQWIDYNTKEVFDVTLDGEKFEIRFDSYRDNGRLALWILGEDSDGMASLLTVNLEAAPCGDRQVYIDVNSMDTDGYQNLIDCGVIDAVPVSTFQSGYVIYPLHNVLIKASKYQLI